jgi:hypothetical protein
VTALVALSAAGAAWGAPAVDEYNSRLPDARGEGHVGPTTPRSQTGELGAIQDELARSPDAATLASIATADELKAPPPALGQIDDDSGRSLLEAILSALGNPLVIALILGLLGITAAALLRRRMEAGRGTS